MRAFFACIVLFVFAGSAMADQLITKSSPHSVADTVSKLTAAVEAAGGTVFAVVDHAGGAAKVGSELAPSTLVILGNPKIGTPIMQNNILAGLDLPLRVLVYEEARQTKVAYLDPDVLKARYEISGADDIFVKVAGALNKLTDAAVK